MVIMSFRIQEVLVVLLCTLIAQIVYAQEQQFIVPDSLANRSPKELADKIRQSSAKEAQIYEQVLATTQKPDINLGGYYYKIAMFFYDKENYDRSAYYLQKSIAILKPLGNDQHVCSVSLKLGSAYLEDWQNQKALDAYYEALAIAQKKGSIEHEIIANSGITIIHKRMKQLDKALEVCKHTIKLTKKSKYKQGKNHVNMLTILSEIYLYQKQYDSVLHHADIGIAMSEPIPYPYGSIDLYTKKGAVFFYRDDLDQAFQNLRLAEEILLKNEIKEKKPILNLNYFLASCYYKQQQYDEAMGYLKDNLARIDQKDFRNIRVLETYRLLADCYSGLGNEQESIIWLQKHTQLRDQFLDEKDKTVQKIHTKDTQELGETIKELESQQEQEARFKKYGIASSIVLLLALMVSLVMYYRKQKANKAKFATLIETTATKNTNEENNLITIDDEKVNTILKGLQKLENQEYFLNTDCNLRTIAKKVKTNTTYLSQIIKTHKEKSFNDYINDLRIEYALQRLKQDKKFRSFSIKSIAHEIGYKSDNSFTKHFKAKTGLNPSYYIKEIEKLVK